MACRRGRLRWGLRVKLASALLLYRSNLSRPGHRFEEVFYLFKRILLLAAYRVIVE